MTPWKSGRSVALKLVSAEPLILPGRKSSPTAVFCALGLIFLRTLFPITLSIPAGRDLCTPAERGQFMREE